MSKDSFGLENEMVSGKSSLTMDGTDGADEAEDGIEETGLSSIRCESAGASS